MHMADGRSCVQSYMNILEAVRPCVMVMELVPGAMDNASTIDAIRFGAAMEAYGFEQRTLNASDQLPQDRTIPIA